VKPSDPTRSAGSAPRNVPLAEDNETTGLPFFHTWRSVYLFVLATFVLWVLLLSILSARFR
jgi:hypothetical protein